MIMKTAIRYYAAFLIALSISFITLANDTTKNGDKKEPVADKVELHFIGKIQEHPVYQLTLNGSEQDEYIVSFRETDGTVVYSNVVKGNFNQRFMLKSEDQADKTLRLDVRAKNSNESRVYIIRVTQNVVEENVIVKLQ
jgi:hypothetical protein